MVFPRHLLLALFFGGASAFAPLKHHRLIQQRTQQLHVATLDSATESSLISTEKPLHVIIAGAGVGGLTLANAFADMPHVKTTVLEKTSKFKRFGGPIQLASNAMQVGALPKMTVISTQST